MSMVHISGWVDATQPSGPEAPGGGHPDNSLPGGGYPSTGPIYGGRPDNSLPDGGGGHVWGALIRWLMRPSGDNSLPKPPGLRPVLPPSIDNGLPPNGGKPPHPWLPGHWEPIDPGFGKPPAWGWVGIDNGLPAPPEPPTTKPLPPEGPPVIGGGPSTPPPTHKPTPPGQGGIWVPTDPDFGKPERPCGGKPHPPIWAWIPDRPEVEPPPIDVGGAATVSPTSGTVLAAGGTVSTTVYPGTSMPDWTVSGLSDWVTASPSSGSGSHMITLTATQNTTGLPKQALVKIGGATFTLNQGAV